MASQNASLAVQISNQLVATKFLNPSQTWLATFLATPRPTTPLPALVQSALFRLLASDITTTLQSSSSTCFAQDISNVEIKERRLSGPIVVQVLDIEDMRKSRWEQIESIEALERGEGTKGREIIRVVATEDGDDPNSNTIMSGGSHKLLLQDTKGTRLYGIELKAVGGVGLGMSIGTKMVLRNVIVARGVILLEPASTTILGGKIESLHKTWKETRKAQLKAAIESSEQTAR